MLGLSGHGQKRRGEGAFLKPNQSDFGPDRSLQVPTPLRDAGLCCCVLARLSGGFISALSSFSLLSWLGCTTWGQVWGQEQAAHPLLPTPAKETHTAPAWLVSAERLNVL